MNERLTLAEAAALIPCHPYTLRRILREAPHWAPEPLPRDNTAEHIKFARTTVERWLADREGLRAKLKSPHKRWLTEVMDDPEKEEKRIVSEEMGIEQQVDAVVALQLRDVLAEQLKLRGKPLNEMVSKFVTEAKLARLAMLGIEASPAA